MTALGPDDLTERQVAAIIAAGDEAGVLLDELRERGPAASADKAAELAEWSAAVDLVRDAFVAAGLDQKRAGRAVTVWLIERRPDGGRVDPRTCIRHADEAPWREPGDPPGGLGQR